MLSQRQINEIKEHLDMAQNPLFFFDNDADGLCSFLLLQRFIGRGKGIAVKSFPDLNASYFRKVQELNADYIFILDKPVVSEGFWKEVEQINIPVVWIDHHKTEKEKIPNFINYYNPLFNDDIEDFDSKKKNTGEPVTVLCYQLTNRKEDLWIALVGSISDNFVPDFYTDFKEKYPDLTPESLHEDAFDIFYNSKIGKISKIFNFALKDRTTNVINMQKFLMKAKTPYEVLEENPKNYTMHQRFNYIEKKYRKLIDKAVGSVSESEILFFQYGGDLSISADIANELSYRFPKKIIVVVYISGAKANISARGKKVREMVLKAIEKLENASGGGHEDAVGAQIKTEDLENFRNFLEQNL